MRAPTRLPRFAVVWTGLLAASSALAGTPICQCPGDVDGDGLVDSTDLGLLLGEWGECTLPCLPLCASDFTGDCLVDAQDLGVLLSSWGACVAEFPDPGPTIAQATELGALGAGPIQLCEYIGPGDADVYAFSLSGASTFLATLTNRVDGAQAWLAADKNENGVIDGADELEYVGTSGAADLTIIEDLAAGDYVLLISPWSSDYTNYSLTVSATPIESLPEDPGSTIATAHELGVSSGSPLEVSDLIGGFDGTDYFAFELAGPREVTVTLTGRTEGAQLWLVADKNGNGVFDGVDEQEYNGTSGSGDFSFAEDLAAGTYFLLVQTWDSNDSTRYTLRVTSTPLATLPQDPGSSILSAFELGTSDDLPIEVVDLIGGFDGTDYFLFDLAEARAVTVTLTGRTEGAQLWLVADKNGNGLFDGVDEQEYDGTSGSGDFAFAEDLASGTYFLRVQTWDSNDSTRYTLRVTSAPLPSLPLDPGSTLGAAHDLGVVEVGMPAAAQELVGGFDGADVYRFEAGSTGVFTATLTGRTEGAQIWLVRDLDGDGIFDGNEDLDYDGTSGSGNLAVTASLTAGLTYFVWVETWDSNDSTRYTLSIFVP